MDYVAYLHKDKESDYGVSFPDFPGCITAGKTLEEARRMAEEALDLHIVGMVEDGEEIPAPSTIDVLEKDPDRKGALAFLVHVDPKAGGRTVRINITARAKQIEEIDRLANQAGLTRSAYMVQSSLHQVRQAARKTVIPAGRKSEIQAAQKAVIQAVQKNKAKRTLKPA